MIRFTGLNNRQIDETQDCKGFDKNTEVVGCDTGGVVLLVKDGLKPAYRQAEMIYGTKNLHGERHLAGSQKDCRDI